MWNFGVISFLTLFIILTWRIADSKKQSLPALDVSDPTAVHLVLLHGRTKREITTTRNEDGSHHLEVTLELSIDNKEYIIDLRLNLDLVTDNHIFSYQKNGTTMLYKPSKEEIELCHYIGTVRGNPDSWVAVSTCHGVQGLLFDGVRTIAIEPLEGEENTSNYDYNYSDLIGSYPSFGGKFQTNGFQGLYANRFNGGSRVKRQPGKGPYFVELVLVTDKSYFDAYNQDFCLIHTQMQILANLLSSIYSELDISISLAGVEVWNEYDRIPFTTNSTQYLYNFLEYKAIELNYNIPNDHAQLITLKQFENDIVGKTLSETICIPALSGAIINTSTKNSAGLLAFTLAHELGHSFGVDDDYVYDEDCRCKGMTCVMWYYRTEYLPTGWSTCSLKALRLHLRNGIAYCLRNKPRPLVDSPVCGNGVVDIGEQCDCSTTSGRHCSACCDPNTCMLRPNLTCDSSVCCHLPICQNQKCRSSSRAKDIQSSDHCECEPSLKDTYKGKQLCFGREYHNSTKPKGTPEEHNKTSYIMKIILYIMLVGTAPATLLIVGYILYCTSNLVCRRMRSTYV